MRLALASLPLLVACAGVPERPEPASPAAPAQELVDVGHARELRGLWVTTVANLDWPSKPGLSVQQQQGELTAILDQMEKTGLNAVFFQVRAEGDAVYASELEPWSRALTGQQGQDPGWDPLQWLIEEAHGRNIEVHAWFNPYRAGNVGSSLAADHMARALPKHTYRYNRVLWMDPGAQEVQDRVVEAVLEVVERYDVDGIHFDDYFYPYPDGTPFPDDRTWRAYVASGGELSRGDWRRQNVNTVIQRVHEGIAARRPWVRFGISPFGIYRPGQPEGVRGLDQYAELYADPVRWIDEGWVDYLAPQLYWPTTASGQPFGRLIDWWSSVAGEGQVFSGHALYRLGEPGWTVDELRRQVGLAREAPRARGQIWFRAANLMGSEPAKALLRELYAQPALPPPVAARAGQRVKPPVAAPISEGVVLDHPDLDGLRAWAVYEERDGAWTLAQLAPAAEGLLALPPGRYAVSAVARDGVESRGAVVEIEGRRQL